MQPEHKPLRIIASNKTLIPNQEKMVADRIKQVGGPKKMEHLLLRKKIISMRIMHEKFAPSQWADGDYDSKLFYLRQQLQKTR